MTRQPHSGSVRTRLLLASLVPMTAGLVLASVFMGIYLRAELRSDAAASLSALVGILGDNASAMLAFDDPQGATTVLGALGTRPDVTQSVIFSGDGRVFASYRRDEDTVVPVQAPAFEGARFVDGRLVAVRPIVMPGQDDAIGTILIESDLQQQQALSRRIWMVTGVVATVAFVVALLLGLNLLKSILRPVSRLAATARTLSEEQDYSVRAEVDSTEELGQLGRAFNGMLDRIEEHEAVLRQRERYFRSLIEHSTDIITVADQGGVVTYVSPSVHRVLGRTPEAYLGRHVTEQVHRDDRGRIREAMAAAETGEPAAMVVRAPHADGTLRTLESVGVRYEDDDGEQTWIINARDVTERRRIEGERERLHSQLVQAQKMETVGQLTGGVAHDFNNLLTVILGNMELMQLGGSLSDGQSELVEQALEAANRGSALTQRLLAFSRRQTLRPEAVDVLELASRMRKLLVRTLGETIQIELHGSSDLWPCEVDAAQLENAVLNLAINARDAMNGGGTLSIDCANICLTGSDDPGEDLASGEYVRLRVEDTGSGMSPDVLDKVFEPFYTTKDVGKGSGLGLSMVYGFVRQSGGQVRIASAVGEGTAVTMYLPRSSAISEAVPVGEVVDQAVDGHGETVLVVEDDPDVLKLTLRQLGALGYRTHSAGDAAEALDVLARTPGIALMLTDVVLPRGMSGLDLAREVHTRSPDISVVYMSGYARDHALDIGTLDPDIDLVKKPFTQMQLGLALRDALTRAKVR